MSLSMPFTRSCTAAPGHQPGATAAAAPAAAAQGSSTCHTSNCSALKALTSCCSSVAMASAADSADVPWSCPVEFPISSLMVDMRLAVLDCARTAQLITSATPKERNPKSCDCCDAWEWWRGSSPETAPLCAVAATALDWTVPARLRCSSSSCWTPSSSRSSCTGHNCTSGCPNVQACHTACKSINVDAHVAPGDTQEKHPFTPQRLACTSCWRA
jgi:hypothetical protein